MQKVKNENRNLSMQFNAFISAGGTHMCMLALKSHLHVWFAPGGGSGSGGGVSSKNRE